MDLKQLDKNVNDAAKMVQENLTERDKLEGLCEECAELIQATSKLIRARGYSYNATPVTEEEAIESFKEEIVDILMVLHALNLPLDEYVEKAKNSPKWLRWSWRIHNSGRRKILDL